MATETQSDAGGRWLDRSTRRGRTVLEDRADRRRAVVLPDPRTARGAVEHDAARRESLAGPTADRRTALAGGCSDELDPRRSRPIVRRWSSAGPVFCSGHDLARDGRRGSEAEYRDLFAPARG